MRQSSRNYCNLTSEKHASKFTHTMWVVFSKRVSFHVYIAVDVHKQTESVLCVFSTTYIPIIGTVRYLIETSPEVTFLDIQRLPWSVTIHNLYFPFEPFVEHPTEHHYKSSSHPDGMRWKTAEVDFHARQVVPYRPVNEYRHFFQKEDFVGLVREYGGVVPIHLGHYTGMNHPLVVESFLLQEITECMKRCRKMWMSKGELAWILDPNSKHYNYMVTEMVEHSVVCLEDDKLALGWVVKATKEINPSFVNQYKQGALPKPVFPSTTMCQSDPSFPVDRFIDARILPSTLLPYVPVLPVIGIQQTCKMDRRFSDKKELRDFINNTIVKDPRVIVVSDAELRLWIKWDNNTTIKMIVGGIQGLRVDEVVTAKHSGDYHLVMRQEKESAAIKIASSLLFSTSRIVGQLRFGEFGDVLKAGENCGTMIFVWSEHSTHPRWSVEIDRFRKMSNVICVAI